MTHLFDPLAIRDLAIENLQPAIFRLLIAEGADVKLIALTASARGAVLAARWFVVVRA
jgi:hypothetical protein